jgi:predicted RNA-binding Zn-ribbon protein involved in translation (DUF1610 family)
MAKNKEIAKCPMCGLEFPNRDAKTEAVYSCVECGAEGYDCCVPGNNAFCPDCGDSDDDDYEEDDEAEEDDVY